MVGRSAHAHLGRVSGHRGGFEANLIRQRQLHVPRLGGLTGAAGGGGTSEELRLAIMVRIGKVLRLPASPTRPRRLTLIDSETIYRAAPRLHLRLISTRTGAVPHDEC